MERIVYLRWLVHRCDQSEKRHQEAAEVLERLEATPEAGRDESDLGAFGQFASKGAQPSERVRGRVRCVSAISTST